MNDKDANVAALVTILEGIDSEGICFRNAAGNL